MLSIALRLASHSSAATLMRHGAMTTPCMRNAGLCARPWPAQALVPSPASPRLARQPLRALATSSWGLKDDAELPFSVCVARHWRRRRRHSCRLSCRHSLPPAFASHGPAPTTTRPQTYTPEENAAYWSTRPVAVVTRTLQISAALGSWLMEGRITNRGASAQALTDARADKLRRLLTDLGPAFVKIGQAISSRWVLGGAPRGAAGRVPAALCLLPHRVHTHTRSPDVAPPEFLRELEKLQDQIPPFCNDEVGAAVARGARGPGLLPRCCRRRARPLHPTTPSHALQAFEVIKAEYGVPASQVFSAISPEAVAGAGAVLPKCGGGKQAAGRGWEPQAPAWQYITPQFRCLPPSPPVLWAPHPQLPRWARCTAVRCAPRGRPWRSRCSGRVWRPPLL